VNAQVIQVEYNRLDRKPERGVFRSVFNSCRRQDLGVLARSPLASGLLTRKYEPGTAFSKGDVRSTQGPRRIAQRLREVQHIAAAEVPERADMAQWALAWCLRNDAVTCAIPGCKDVSQVESSAAAAELARSDHPHIRPPGSRRPWR
jgi:aryl-alcohol dehydrogenase-like predicted oxidoreductase